MYYIYYGITLCQLCLLRHLLRHLLRPSQIRILFKRNSPVKNGPVLKLWSQKMKCVFSG